MSDLRENVQRPASPRTSKTKRLVKNQGNPAAVRIGDTLKKQIRIKFGQKNDESFLANFGRQERTNKEHKTTKNPNGCKKTIQKHKHHNRATIRSKPARRISLQNNKKEHSQRIHQPLDPCKVTQRQNQTKQKPIESRHKRVEARREDASLR